MVWASRWSVASRTFYIGKFFLCYIVLFSSETSARGSPGNYLYINSIPSKNNENIHSRKLTCPFPKAHFKDDVPASQVGYVSSLEGMFSKFFFTKIHSLAWSRWSCAAAQVLRRRTEKSPAFGRKIRTFKMGPENLL